MSMALYPRQNSTFCLQHCCFELMLIFTIQYSTSIFQHCAFTNQHPYFKFSVLCLHATFVCVCAIRLHRNPTFLFSVFTHQHPYFKFTSVRLSATFMPFIAMLMFGVCVAVQSAICLQHNAIFLLDIELHAWVSWPSDGTPLYKTCGLKSGRGLHVKMAAFRRAYDIIQQTIESLDNPAITSFEIDGISNLYTSEPW